MAANTLNFTRSGRMLRLIQIPRELEVQPELRICTKHLLEPQRRIRCHAALAMNQLIQSRIGHANPFGQRSLADAEGPDEFLEEDFPRVRGSAVLRYSHYLPLSAL